MIATWMLSSVVFTALLGIAALCAEWGLRSARRATRWPWLLALAAGTTASLLLAQCLEISEILRPATRAFVLPKGRTTENRNVHSRHIAFHAILPGSVERYAADRCKDVDPIRRKSQLSDDIRPYEVVERDAKVNERSTEGRERCQDARRVHRVRLYQDIEVAGRAGDAVHGKRVRAHDQKNHLMGDKLTKHVAKIVDHLLSCAPCSRSVDNFPGISFRE